ncbi:hypothetical protein GGI21_003801 [Coemansia aciculifera]|uniref:Uncharacterized protein n=1 Tax=Coemansia aciculifera TaxID=417176 RepID=A0ACC1M852_9FUNG|nr:hypothetical protein IWW38_001418 [Coemansia aciculifera]KAJ2907525.1 hypothetical protein GGI21_003801 [Coemansia aciculifera]
MDSYSSNYAYAASADANAYMSSLRYPGMGMTPMLGPMDPAYNVPATSEPAPFSNTLPCSSRIGSKSSSSFIFRHDEDHGASKIKCHQLCTSDGRMFIEHLPNHSILYIPNSSSIEQALCELRKPRSQTKQQKLAAGALTQKQEQPQLSQPKEQPLQPLQQQLGPQPPVVRKPKEKSTKPINSFIKYRSFKIAELKKQHPEVSQTEISRLAGECWKSEDEEIKNQFRIQYQEEKRVYDLKKSVTMGAKRIREASVTPSEHDAILNAASLLGEPTSAPLSDACDSSTDAGVYPADFNSKRRRRSLTLPQTDISACVRSSSSSPMLQASSSAKRRRCVTTELRRQLAAKSSAIMATPPPPPAASFMPGALGPRSHSTGDDLHQHYASPAIGGYYGDLSIASGSEHLVISAHSSPAMLAAMHPHGNASYLNDMSLPLNASFGMHSQSDFVSMSPPLMSNNGSVLSINTSFVSNGPSADYHSAPFDIYTSPAHDDLANSVVNAHLVAANLSSYMAAGGDTAAYSHHGFNDSMDSLSAPEYFHAQH